LFITPHVTKYCGILIVFDLGNRLPSTLAPGNNKRVVVHPLQLFGDKLSIQSGDFGDTISG
jgi:hypothetical protein